MEVNMQWPTMIQSGKCSENTLFANFYSVFPENLLLSIYIIPLSIFFICHKKYSAFGLLYCLYLLPLFKCVYVLLDTNFLSLTNNNKLNK
jgi:hypothetical protein